LPRFICVTCGTQFAESAEEPANCPICLDERQYVGLDGQQWITLPELQHKHRNKRHSEEPDLTSFSTDPHFAIGQRAFLIESPGGNILWDCISLIDDETADFVRSRGGISRIAMSHPHYYTTMLEWSERFDNPPILLHEADRQWVMRHDNRIRFWSGDTLSLHDGLTLIRCGGHFEGGTVLHWPAAANGRGALLTGDILQVTPDRKWVSFMYSYPNYIPLNAAQVRHIARAVEGLRFVRIYGAFPKVTIAEDGPAVVRRSEARYLRAITDAPG